MATRLRVHCNARRDLVYSLCSRRAIPNLTKEGPAEGDRSMIRGERRTGGFTLVELLVVIGIIAVLIGLLLPALSRAREQGRTAKCLSNLRSIGQAMNIYSTENKGFIVPGSVQWYDGGSAQGGRGEENWATMLVML